MQTPAAGAFQPQPRAAASGLVGPLVPRATRLRSRTAIRKFSAMMRSSTVVLVELAGTTVVLIVGARARCGQGLSARGVVETTTVLWALRPGSSSRTALPVRRR
jgi:hypothetical protein